MKQGSFLFGFVNDGNISYNIKLNQTSIIVHQTSIIAFIHSIRYILSNEAITSIRFSYSDINMYFLRTIHMQYEWRCIYTLKNS